MAWSRPWCCLMIMQVDDVMLWTPDKSIEVGDGYTIHLKKMGEPDCGIGGHISWVGETMTLDGQAGSEQLGTSSHFCFILILKNPSSASSFHAAIPVSDQKVLISGGCGVRGAFRDAFTFHLGKSSRRFCYQYSRRGGLLPPINPFPLQIPWLGVQSSIVTFALCPGQATHCSTWLMPPRRMQIRRTRASTMRALFWSSGGQTVLASSTIVQASCSWTSRWRGLLWTLLESLGVLCLDQEGKIRKTEYWKSTSGWVQDCQCEQRLWKQHHPSLNTLLIFLLVSSHEGETKWVFRRSGRGFLL